LRSRCPNASPVNEGVINRIVSGHCSKEAPISSRSNEATQPEIAKYNSEADPSCARPDDDYVHKLLLHDICLKRDNLMGAMWTG
jgi:hypothetical protein